MFRRFYRLKHGTPAAWPDMPELRVHVCPCGLEDFQEEFSARGRCIECGRVYVEERAA
jgi:hypothetical protein